MYIRKRVNILKNGGYDHSMQYVYEMPTYQVMETYRDHEYGGKIRQRVLLNLGTYPTPAAALADYRNWVKAGSVYGCRVPVTRCQIPEYVKALEALAPVFKRDGTSRYGAMGKAERAKVIKRLEDSRYKPMNQMSDEEIKALRPKWIARNKAFHDSL